MRKLISWFLQKLQPYPPTGIVAGFSCEGRGWCAVVKLTRPIGEKWWAAIDGRTKKHADVHVNQKVHIVAFRPEREGDILWIEELG